MQTHAAERLILVQLFVGRQVGQLLCLTVLAVIFLCGIKNKGAVIDFFPLFSHQMKPFGLQSIFSNVGNVYTLIFTHTHTNLNSVFASVPLKGAFHTKVGSTQILTSALYEFALTKDPVHYCECHHLSWLNSRGSQKA